MINGRKLITKAPPLLIQDRLGRNQNAVITLTEHYATNGKKYFKRLLSKNEEEGGKGSIKDKQVHLEKEGSKLKILNGVEASYKHESNHVIIAGVSTKEKEKYMLQNTEELKKALKKAEYAYPTHPFMPKAGIKKEILDEICQIIKKSEARLFTPFPAGYGPRYNKMARGLKNNERDIYDLRRKYSAPLIPDHDHHIHLPKGKNGLGLLKNSSIGKEFPLRQIENCHIVKAKRSKIMQNLWRAGRTYSEQLPGYRKMKPFWKLFNTPYKRDQFEKLRDRYYKKELEDINIEKLNQRSQPLSDKTKNVMKTAKMSLPEKGVF